VDTGVVMQTPPSLTARTGPAAGNLVELFDPETARPITAVVELVREDALSIRFKTPARPRGRARARWFDGEDAWEVVVDVSPGASTDIAELAVIDEWEPVSARQSLRLPVDRHPLLVEVVKARGNAHADGRRFDLVCIDISATGCRATAPGRCPAPGDLVRVAWVRGDEWARVEPEWVHARVIRSETRPFGGGRVGFRFELDDEQEAERVRMWRDAWARVATEVGV
jgi:hypothetical protein